MLYFSPNLGFIGSQQQVQGMLPSQYLNPFYLNANQQFMQSNTRTPPLNTPQSQSIVQASNQSQPKLVSKSTTAAYSTPQPYYAYPSQAQLDPNYLYKNLLNSQSNNSYFNFGLQLNQQDTTINQKNNHLYLYSANNSKNDMTSLYPNYINQELNQQIIDTSQSSHQLPSTNFFMPYQTNNLFPNQNLQLKNHINQQNVSPKNNSQYFVSPNTIKNNSQPPLVQQQKSITTNPLLKTKIDNSQSGIQSNKKNNISNFQIPKYVKPKLCKSPLMLHSKKDKKLQQSNLVKSPTLNTSLQSQPLKLIQNETQIAPPPLLSTFSTNQQHSILSQKSENLNSSISSTFPIPASPILPPLSLPSIDKKTNPITYFNRAPNFVPNNSKNNLINFEFDKSLSSSFNSTVFDNTGLNSSNNNITNTNYNTMLISPTLRTIYDKKIPPPPYPGKQNYETKMEIDDETNNNIHESKKDTLNVSSTTTTSTQSNHSVIRYCSPQAFKFFMEQHAENVLKNHKAREYRRFQLENEMTKVDLTPNVKKQMRKLLQQKETNYLRLRRAKMNKNMFEHIKVLGIGAFGEVNLVRKRDDVQRLYAMKILHKSDVFNRNQAAHVKAERDILAEADNEWVVKLYYSFQDEESLYFVMDYVPGGDLMNLLIKFQIFSEELSRFYIGELTCAIESVHNLGFIHRDIKPDNILIDKNGHIKLTDFGLCTGFHWTHNSKYYRTDEPYNRLLDVILNKSNSTTNGLNNDKRLMAHSLVGTPNYIAPEILSRKGYTKSCDWWSVGVIFYEMLVGAPPFRDDTSTGTQIKVINWKKTLKFPESSKLSEHAKDLILKLCTDAEIRLSSDGIKEHKFFENFDFAKIRRTKAPYIPQIKHSTDTSNFEPIDNKVLLERKARIEETHRNNQILKNKDEKLNNENTNLTNVNKKEINRIDMYDKNNISNNYTNNNPMLYEFAFRRFFDEVHTSENFNRLNEDLNSLSTSINTTTTTATTTMTSTHDDKEIEENRNDIISPLSPSLTTMMESVTT